MSGGQYSEGILLALLWRDERTWLLAVHSVDTISFGESADKVRLRDIAQKTGGIFSDADSVEELQKVYARLNYTVRYLEHRK